MYIVLKLENGMNFILSGRQYDSFLNVVAHDGKLHWYNGSDVVTYDPFDGGQTIFIDGSEIVISRSDPWINRSECLGVCQGFLRCMRLEYAVVGGDDDNLSVWELKDYESRRMILTLKISFDNMIFKDPDLRHVSMSSMSMFAPEATAFHPNNKDVVCLFVFPHFILCNIQSGEFESSIRLYTEKSNTPTKSCQLRSLGGQHQFQRFHKMHICSDAVTLVLSPLFLLSSIQQVY
ncbi:hypothetical protein NC651_022955 [Populus alba x Populus x berolinensis]|nr:hypothetical protein NC651_022955 [Populus alba x Populus x berolinensis]